NVNSTPTWKQYNRPWYMKLLLSIWGYIKNVGLMIWSVIKAIPFKLWGLLLAIGGCFQGLWYRFRHGDWRTRMSYLIMGFGNFSRGKNQIVKGLLWFLVEALYALFMVFVGVVNLSKLFVSQAGLDYYTIGVIAKKYRPSGMGFDFVDNSVTILLYTMLTLILTIFFIYMWIKYTKVAYETQKRVEAGKSLSTMKQQLNFALNDGYHVTILALPIIGVLIITVLPLLANILVAFTNFNRNHMIPANLFGWVGFKNFGAVFGSSYGSIIWKILGWTLVWAFFATFTNFFFGMFLAMMINKKSIKLKPLWRTSFIIVIAIPDFITLLMMSKFFGFSNSSLTGAFNKILQQWFHLDVNIDWLGGATSGGGSTLARTMVIIINMWRGMPYTMLATSGILMNIPDELYESSRIDGAGPVRRFISITFPYIMFVMAPQLITTFTGNINNFNVIFFLTGGGPKLITKQGIVYGQTELLITWLYNLTIADGSNQEYGNAAVIGIFIFIITSFFSLIVFNLSLIKI
ncbi:MAG: sugar ABC transporter permease, partial [Clostridiales bacterium]|nr:sugar ABC transporter permease [Clostridiales bacterium]